MGPEAPATAFTRAVHWHGPYPKPDASYPVTTIPPHTKSHIGFPYLNSGPFQYNPLMSEALSNISYSSFRCWLGTPTPNPQTGRPSPTYRLSAISYSIFLQRHSIARGHLSNLKSEIEPCYDNGAHWAFSKFWNLMLIQKIITSSRKVVNELTKLIEPSSIGVIQLMK
jgi:hypothetical protein